MDLQDSLPVLQIHFYALPPARFPLAALVLVVRLNEILDIPHVDIIRHLDLAIAISVMTDMRYMPSRTLLRWLESPDRRINADFVVTIALLWRLPDWIRALLLDRAYIHFSETNRRHLALQYILKVLWSEGVDKGPRVLRPHL